MSSGYRASNGADFDDLFAPRTTAVRWGNCGARTPDGQDLVQRYEYIGNGTPLGYNVGLRGNDGVDMSQRWAAKGTTLSTLPINGTNYTANNPQRGTAQIRYLTLADGTFQVLRIAQNGGNEGVIAAGTWLPSGDNAGLYTVQYSITQSGSTVGSSASYSTTNGAPTQTAVSSQPSVAGKSTAILVTERASSNGSMSIQYFRSGVLRVSGVIYYNTNADGN